MVLRNEKHMRLGKNKATRSITTGVVLSAALWGISGCSSDAEEEELPAIVETTPDDATAEEDSASADSFADYTGVYDEQFYDDVEFYVGTEVTVAAIVGEVISPNVFTIVDVVNGDEQDAEETDVDLDEVVIEPLLIVHEQEIAGLTPGQPVGVVGVVREEFRLATIEGELGVDLDEGAFEERDELAYIEVTDASAMAGVG